MLLISNDTRHSMRLTCACLTIGEDGTVVALQNVLNDGCGRLLVDLTLIRIVSIGHIEGELFGVIAAARLGDIDLTSPLIDVHSFHVALTNLFLIQGSATDGHFDCLVLVR